MKHKRTVALMAFDLTLSLLPAAVLADGYNGDAIVQDGLDLIASRRRLRFKSVGI